MNGFISNWDPESRNGRIHACPDENGSFTLLGEQNSGVADQLDAIYPNGFDHDSMCPGPPDSVRVTFTPTPEGTALGVVITSQPVGDAHTLALQASAHARSASAHVEKLGALEGVPSKTLAAAHAAATAAHSAAASALASAAQLRATSAKPSGPSAPPAKTTKARRSKKGN